MLYRFMSLEAFLEILLRGELSFVSPLLWDDPYEIHFVKKIDFELSNKAKNGVERHSDFQRFKPLLTLKYYMESIRAQCWTSIPESDAFWRIYNNSGKTIRVSMKKESVDRIEGVIQVDVNYVDSLDVLENYDLCDEKDFYELFCTKRSAFKHENEVRLLKCDVANGHNDHTEDVVYGMFLDYFLENYLQRHNHILDSESEKPLLELFAYRGQMMTIDDYRFEMEKYRMPEIVRVPVKVSEIIENVMVSPFAPDWYVDLVEMLCDRYGIKSLGKSRLYQL